jgi:maltose alpha-D-glucosyltransferase/alpha-amylase
MVTDKERDYLWSFYAAERRARINMGIRRRLAPLVENDRRKIELLNSLLLSMPGTPVLYYGDEIGMGDNIYLGDRDGVRTPMQWTPDRNGGFSKSDPAKLFLPAIQDPIYGFDAVNVESQLRSPASLLNWTRRMVSIRRNHRVFGRGSLRFLYPSNRKVLAYLREHEGEAILCVANLSRAPQAVELDLADFNGATPTELTGGTPFPKIGELTYLLTLPAYGFYWFSLNAAEEQTAAVQPITAPELFTLVLTGKPETILKGRERTAFERTIVPRFIASRRWFAGKGAGLKSVRVLDFASLRNRAGGDVFLLPAWRSSSRTASGTPIFRRWPSRRGTRRRTSCPTRSRACGAGPGSASCSAPRPRRISASPSSTPCARARRSPPTRAGASASSAAARSPTSPTWRHRTCAASARNRATPPSPSGRA